MRVSLDDGAITEIVPGEVTRSFHRPRWSPDGDSVIVSVHEAGRWRLALVPATGGALRFVDPDDGASRYGADFLESGREVVTTSERGGIAHLERLELATGRARPLTRTTGSHIAPEVTPRGDTVYFLALHARGYDLRRIPADSVLAEEAPPLFAASFGPAVPPPLVPPADTFPVVDTLTSRSYGLGPRSWQLLPGLTAAPDGISGTLALASSDPVGRLSWLLQGVAGERGSWQGGSLSTELRTFLPYLRADLFATRHRPSAGGEGAIVHAVAGEALDADHAGASLSLSMARRYAAVGWAARAGVSGGRLGVPTTDEEARFLGHATLAGTLDLRRDRNAFVQGLRLDAATGSTHGEHWSRALATYDLGVTWLGRSVRGSATGGVVSADAPPYEAFVLGGVPSPLVAPGLLDQRRDMAAIPFAVAVGTRLRSYRVETDLLGTVAYLWGASAGPRYDAPWHRVVGVESEFSFTSIPFLALPGVTVRGGVARSLDEPFEDRTRVYFGVRYRP